MEKNKGLSTTDVIALTEKEEKANLEKLELKVNEIDEKIRNKVESILLKENIDYMDYQLLNSYRYDLKNKIDNIKRNDSNEELIQLMSKALSKKY